MTSDPLLDELEQIMAKKSGKITPEEAKRLIEAERAMHMERGRFFRLEHRAREGSFWWSHGESYRQWSDWGHYNSKAEAIERAHWANVRYAGNVYRVVDIRTETQVWDNIKTSTSSTRSSG